MSSPLLSTTAPVATAALMKVPSLMLPILGTKVVRLAATWVSAYFAAKTLQDAYIDKVFMKESEPPSLVTMTFTFSMFQALFGALLLGVVTMALYVSASSVLTVKGFAALGFLDAAIELGLTSGILYLIASKMEQKKFFNYRYEGLRAIRALRELMLPITACTIGLPYFMFVDRKLLFSKLTSQNS